MLLQGSETSKVPMAQITIGHSTLNPSGSGRRGSDIRSNGYIPATFTGTLCSRQSVNSLSEAVGRHTCFRVRLQLYGLVR